MAVLSSRLRRAQEPVPVPPVQQRKAIVAAASAIPLDGSSWKNFKLGDTQWQVEGWKHYDICGELRFVANWIGSSVSRCRLYIAELDELGKPGDEVEEADIAVLAETVFGGPANKAEALRLLGTHLYVPGESFIVAEGVSNAKEDRWYVVSTSSIKRQGEREIKVERPQEYGGGWYTLREGQDLLIRVWTPHPRKYDAADSSVRPALPILREIEQLTKHIFAQIDSRLAGAGLLLLPDQLDFPKGEDDPDGTAGLMKVLQRAMAAALADRSDPSSLVPIMAQVPGEFIDKVRHITFETPLAAQGMEIRDRAIRRLGLSLDVDPEILLGKGDTNHWSAWQLEETTIKVHIEPILARICDALTTGYLRAALTVLGKDPDAYTFWYDTSPLAVRPNRQADGMVLFEADALSEEAVRAAGAWSEDDAPKDDERARRLAAKLVLADPSLIREKAIQEALGVSWEISAPEAPALPGAEADADAPTRARARTGAPARERALPDAPAGAGTPAQAALLMGAHMVVQRSLELAGKRLLTRANRDKFRDVPPWELHTVIHVLEPDHADRLLDDTFGTVQMLAERTGVPAGDLREALAGYCRELFVRAIPHDIDMLEEYLGWCLEASRERAGQFHLPGRHDQRNHGRRQGRRGFEPFTPGQRRERETERREGVDPDRDAPAPSRQGRRAMAMWEAYARQLGVQEQLTPPQEQALEAAAVKAVKLEKDLRRVQQERSERGFETNVAVGPAERKIIPKDMNVMADIEAAVNPSGRPEAREARDAARIRLMGAMKATYEMTDPESGLKVELSGVYFSGNQAQAELSILDKDGRRVGTCQRVWKLVGGLWSGGTSPERNGPVRVRAEHAYLSLRSNVQGGGFSKRFNARAEQAYQEANVEAIEIHANIDVGGYAWARQGYLFRGLEYAEQAMSQYRRRARGAAIQGELSDEWIKAVDELAARMTPENFHNGTAPTPMEMALLGWKPGEKTWPGKTLMLGMDWYGVKPMNRAAYALAASITSVDELAYFSDGLDLWHGVWTDEYAAQVPVNLADRHPNAEGQSDYNEHQQDISAPAEIDDVFMVGVLALLANESLSEA